ncbi:MAG: ABC transporter permease [Phycisphaerae bacterium]
MTAAATQPLSTPRPMTPMQRQWARFRRNRLAVASAWMLLAVATACAVSVPWTHAMSVATDLAQARRPPSAHALLGTDLLGRSMAARCLFGGVISLAVGLAAASISVLLGVAWGAVAGWSGGRTDAVMMRIVDVLYGLPYILLVILLKLGLDGLLRHRLGLRAETTNVVILLLAIGGVSWLTMARVIRGQVLALKVQPFIEAAQALGLPTGRILIVHILPNIVGPILVYATLTVPQAILQESFLSFLGIGIQPPMPSWGNLAAEGVTAINNVASFWWQLLFPCALLTTTLLCLNFIGDGLRDAFDPKTA